MSECDREAPVRGGYDPETGRSAAGKKIVNIAEKEEHRDVYTILTLVTKSREMRVPCGLTDGHGMCNTRNNNMWK